MKALTADDAEQTVEVTAGEQIVVTLEENPTTGYRWIVDELVGHLTTDSSEFAAPGSERPGAGGHRAIVLRATDAGPAELRVRYARPWEGAASDARRLRFQFLVKPA
jgi:inhibitor of cysteine peptidase